MEIKNIVFDVGNVLVRYDPASIVSQAFPLHKDKASLVQSLFKEKIWYDLNLGYITEEEAIQSYHRQLGITLEDLQSLLVTVKSSLIPIPGTIELLKTLHRADFNIYALTDNTHGIMAYLKERYDFWPLLKGIVVSAEIGHLKPSKEIYHHLLTTYLLKPHETVFIDDIARNVEGAIACGIRAIQFSNIEQCISDLEKMRIRVER